MKIEIFDLGICDFQSAWQFQKNIFAEVKNGRVESALIVSSHYPVITMGRLAKKENILLPEYKLNERGIRIYQTERGGDVTYHGPGQVIAYPIFDLRRIKKDIHLFLRQLEGVVISLLSDFGVKGLRLPGLTGVWVEKRKIASIGIAIKNWITFHGLSVNVEEDDLDNFRLIKPCGMDIKMTSLEKISGEKISMKEIKNRLIDKFNGVFLKANSSGNRPAMLETVI